MKVCRHLLFYSGFSLVITFYKSGSLEQYVVTFVVQVLVTDPEKLDAIRQREADITKERIQKILAVGTNVVLCTGGIDDLCLKV